MPGLGMRVEGLGTSPQDGSEPPIRYLFICTGLSWNPPAEGEHQQHETAYVGSRGLGISFLRTLWYGLLKTGGPYSDQVILP